MPFIHLRPAAIYLALALLSLSPLFAQVMIHEIMYRPADVNDSEPTELEFIELYNPTATPFDLSGHSFSNGINYTFEPGTIIPAEGYLVVSASPSDFAELYPSASPVVGPWSGRLSNSGERIELIDPTGQTIDEIRYSDQGDWAQRVEGPLDLGHRGWEWQTRADGGSRSLELINPTAGNTSGQNWTESTATNGTPGAQNSVHSTASAAFIEEIQHSPSIPKPSEWVTISAEITPNSTAPITPILFWRISNANPGIFTASPMSLGTQADRYFADVPPHPESTVIEFYLEVSTTETTTTWPAPTNVGQAANALFQFDSETRPENEPIYRLIFSTPEDLEFTGSNDRSNALFNATFIADDGSNTPTVRYLCGVRVRGASSRRDNPRPLRVELPHDSPYNGFASLNLNTQFTWLQHLGMRLFQSARLPAPNTKRVQVRRNGINRARNVQEQFSSYVHVEPLSGDFIDQAFPNSDGGNLYKKTRPDESWAWHDGDIDDYLGDGWSKQTNGSANDWSDLDSLLETFQNFRPSDDLGEVEALADIDQWMRWFALMSIIANGETNISNGTDDDYSIYNNAGLFTFLPHDLDTILGEGDNSRIENPQHTIFDMLEDDDILEPLVPFFQHPQIRPRYFSALRDLLDTTFEEESFESFVDQQLQGWVPENRIDDLKTFARLRTSYIRGLINDELGPPSTPPSPNSIDTLDRPTGNLVLSEILADGPGPDFVELHNPTQNEIDLSGYILSDNLERNTNFTFPTGTSIQSGAWLVVELDENSPFALSNNGETLTLLDPNQNLIDSISWGPQIPSFSISRTGPTLSTWALTLPSPGAASSAPLTLGSPSDLTINEWLARSAPLFDSDFVELFNASPLPVSLGGLALSDDPINSPSQAILPPLSFIGPRGFVLFQARGADADQDTPTDLPFRLSGSHEMLSLRAPNGIFIDQVSFACPPSAITQGRLPDGAAEISLLPLPTPAAPNISPEDSNPTVINALRLRQNLRITELMYHNDDAPLAEFIELQNTGSTPLDLSQLTFTNGINFTFPDGTLLEPGAYLILTSSQTQFQAIYGSSVTISGTYTGRLRNSGEKLTLSLPAPLATPILSFTYNDSWYPSTDGSGFSLQLRTPLADASTFDQRESWAPSGRRLGSPGSSGSPIVTSPQFTSAVQFEPFQFQVTAINNPTEFRLLDAPDGVSIDPTTGLITGTIETIENPILALSISNLEGESTSPLRILVEPLPLPELTSPVQIEAFIGLPFSYQITATTGLVSFQSSQPPAWLTLDPDTGTFTGIPTTVGTFTFPITFSNQAGSTSANLTITVAADPLAEATESPRSLASSGDATWFRQTSITFDSEDAAQSGDVIDDQNSDMSLELEGPARLRFYWQVSSEIDFDFLNLLLDNQLITRIDGEQDWTLMTLEIPEGSHTVTWSYTKDGSVTNGDDAGWVDLIDLVPLQTFTDWQAANGVSASALPTDDLDDDGYPLLLEYALGGSPLTPDNNLLPFTRINGRPAFDLTKPSDISGIQYIAEGSNDLLTWTTDNIQIVTDNEEAFEAIDTSNAPRQFMRLRVIERTE